MTRRFPGLAALLGLVAVAGAARPAEPPDADTRALELADKVPATLAQPSDWRTFVEGGYGGTTTRVLGLDGPVEQDRRLSLDAHYERSVAPGLSMVVADRLDLAWPPLEPRQYGINTLKDAYVAWQPRNDTLADIDRINVREGVATGYNPTDYFRQGAVRSIISVDPASIKENRQGSAMLRGQTLWDGGSITGIVSPQLGATPSNNGWNPDWAATNPAQRELLSLSQKLADGFSPQLLLYHAAGQPTQAGLNLTGLVNDSTVVYGEWSGGASLSQLSQALARQGLPHANDRGFRNRLATGASYTTADKLSLTLEYQFDGGALGRADWDQLYRQQPAAYVIYRLWLLDARELPTRRALMAYAKWLDAFVNHLDLSALQTVDLIDYSRLDWIEARYHFEHTEMALQWQRYGGSPVSDFGVSPQIRSWQVVLRYYF